MCSGIVNILNCHNVSALVALIKEPKLLIDRFMYEWNRNIKPRTIRVAERARS
jgi:hypothetical protein